jgi:hypothetical protein
MRFAALLLVALAAAPASAAAQRQTFSGTFSASTPATPTGFAEAIDYAPSGGEGTKPHSVAKVTLTFAPGTRIDTTVPERCSAGDSEFQSQGAAACPPDSRVGGGEVEVDFGAEGGAVPRVVNLAATLFNADGALIVFFESTNTSPVIRTAARSPITGTTITTQAPPLPGAPPSDPYMAIKRVRLTFDAVVRGGRGYLTTPPACSGAWSTEAGFTYRDGVAESVASPSPCRAPVGPRVRVAGLPRHGCLAAPTRLRVRVSSPTQLKVTRVRLDGRRLARSRRSRFTVHLDPRRLRPGIHRLTVRAVDREGRSAQDVVAFRRCARV